MELPRRNWRQLISDDKAFVLVVFVPLTTLCIVAFIQELRFELSEAHWLAGPIILWPLLLPVVLYLKGQRTLFTLAAAVLIPLEILMLLPVAAHDHRIVDVVCRAARLGKLGRGGAAVCGTAR